MPRQSPKRNYLIMIPLDLMNYPYQVKKTIDTINAAIKDKPIDKKIKHVEAVFGNIKQNKKFTRFMLRGKENVLIECSLIALAHNLAKMARN